MQYQVPQFIETEDTIVLHLTMKQFILISIGGLVSFFLYFALQFWLWAVASALIVGSGFALALLKVNGRPLPQVLRAMLNFYFKPQIYVWHPEVPKSETALQSVGGGLDLQKIISGLALKNVWQSVQVRGKKKGDAVLSGTQYELFRRQSGEPRVARRVDYR